VNGRDVSVEVSSVGVLTEPDGPGPSHVT
jgi:hypothetical protein